MTLAEPSTAPLAVPGVEDKSTDSTVRQSDWRTRYPARAVGTDWPATCADRAEVDQLVA